MSKIKRNQSTNPLSNLCQTIRKLVFEQNFKNCEKLICKAMEEFPHAPEPHNLLGIILEKTGNHYLAMKHFRAAWALDPSYTPANHNLEKYGTFHCHSVCAFDESDIVTYEATHFSTHKNKQGR